MNDLMKYTGTVRIQFKLGDTVYSTVRHNEGLQPLFYLLSRALAGESTVSLKPTKIDLREQKNGIWESALNRISNISGLSYGTDESGDWVTRATTTIAYTQLRAGISAGSDYRLYLMSEKDDLAYLEVPYQDLSKITAGTQALIDWTLKITN